MSSSSSSTSPRISAIDHLVSELLLIVSPSKQPQQQTKKPTDSSTPSTPSSTTSSSTSHQHQADESCTAIDNSNTQQHSVTSPPRFLQAAVSFLSSTSSSNNDKNESLSDDLLQSHAAVFDCLDAADTSGLPNEASPILATIHWVPPEEEAGNSTNNPLLGDNTSSWEECQPRQLDFSVAEANNEKLLQAVELSSMDDSSLLNGSLDHSDDDSIIREEEEEDVLVLPPEEEAEDSLLQPEEEDPLIKQQQKEDSTVLQQQDEEEKEDTVMQQKEKQRDSSLLQHEQVLQSRVEMGKDLLAELKLAVVRKSTPHPLMDDEQALAEESLTEALTESTDDEEGFIGEGLLRQVVPPLKEYPQQQQQNENHDSNDDQSAAVESLHDTNSLEESSLESLGAQQQSGGSSASSSINNEEKEPTTMNEKEQNSVPKPKPHHRENENIDTNASLLVTPEQVTVRMQTCPSLLTDDEEEESTVATRSLVHELAPAVSPCSEKASSPPAAEGVLSLHKDNNDNNNTPNHAAALPPSLPLSSLPSSPASPNVATAPETSSIDSSQRPQDVILTDTTESPEAARIDSRIPRTNEPQPRPLDAKKKLSDYIGRDLWNPHDPETVLAALLVIGQTATDQPHSRGSIARTGGLLGIVRAMEQHYSYAPVQMAACRALEALSLDPENELAIAEVGGLEAVLAAMVDHHPNHPDVHEAAWSALWNLSGWNALGELSTIDDTTTGTGGSMLQAMVSCMQRHGGHAGVQKNACGTLTNLCLDHPKRLQALVDAGGFVAISQAVQTHWTNPAVRGEASRALSMLLEASSQEEDCME